MTSTVATIEKEETTTTMQCIVSQKALVAALTSVAPAVASRSTLPILHNVLIKASTLGVKLVANNLEMCAIARIPLDETTIGDYGACTVNFKELLALVKPLKNELLYLSARDNDLVIENDTLSVSLPGIDAGEFPCEPTPSEKTKLAVPQSITLPVETLRSATNLVSYAAANDDSRPILTSIRVGLTNDVLELAAADGFRLTRIQERVECAGSWPFALLIPAVSLRETLKKCPKTGNVTLSASSSLFATLTCGSGAWHMRLVEGTYPNFEQVIPKMCTVIAEVEVQALKNALLTVAPIVCTSSNITRLHINGAIDVLASRDGMTSPMVVHVPAQTTNAEGEETEILLNWKYVMDVLTAHPSGSIQFEMNGPMKPAKVLYPDLPGFTGVIMPMHVNR